MAGVRRLIAPQRSDSHAIPVPAPGEWPLRRTLTAAPGITPRTTPHFCVTSQQPPSNLLVSAVQASIDDVAAHCEDDFQKLVSLFGFAPALQFQVDLSQENAAAYHYGCDGTEIEADIGPPARFSVMAEVTEVFEYHYNLRPESAGGPWNCGITNGEGLSQALAKVVSDGQTPYPFQGGPALWNRKGRPNVFVASGQQPDRDPVANGGALLFLNWLRWELGYSWQQIINAPGDCLDAVYHSLTGATDSYTQLTTVLDSNGMTAGTFFPDNPFPLGWMIALERPAAAGGTIALHQNPEGGWRVLPDLFGTNAVTGAQLQPSVDAAHGILVPTYDEILVAANIPSQQTFGIYYWGTDAGIPTDVDIANGVSYSLPRLATTSVNNFRTTHIVAIHENLFPVHFTAGPTGNFKAPGFTTELLSASFPVVDASLAGTGTTLHYINVVQLPGPVGGGIVHRMRTGGQWTDWGNLTEVAGLPSCRYAACAAWPDGQLAVIAITSDGRMLVTLRDPASGNWTKPTTPPHPPPNLRSVAAACVTPKQIKGVVVDAQGTPWTFLLIQSTGIMPRPTTLTNLDSELGSSLGPVSGLSCARVGGP